MAAPSVQTRGTPAGSRLKRGWRSKFTFGLATTLPIWEFEIQLFEVDGGPPIPLSTFFNSVFHTKAPQALLDFTQLKVKGLYDPDIWKDANGYKTILNIEQACTLLWPTTGTLSFFGFPTKMRFTTLMVQQTEAPAVEFDVEVSNWDPVNRVEAGPAYADGYTGTSDT